MRSPSSRSSWQTPGLLRVLCYAAPVILLSGLLSLIVYEVLPTTTTTTINPAIAMKSKIGHPKLLQMKLCWVFFTSTGALFFGAALGLLLWSADVAVGTFVACVVAGVEDSKCDNAQDGLLVKAEEGRQPLLDNGITQSIMLPFPEATIIEQFLALSQTSPGASVLHWVTTQCEAWSLHRLQGMTLEVAHLLRSAEVHQQATVAICLQGGPALLVAILGTWAIKAAWLPLDPLAPWPRLAAVIDEGQPSVVVCQDPSLFKMCQKPLLLTDPSVVGKFSLAVDSAVDSVRKIDVATLELPDSVNVAQIIFTSGSTGVPKGVIYSHRRISHACHFFGEQSCISSGTRVLQKTPHIWAVFRHEVFPALCRGGVIVFADPGRRKDPMFLAELLQSEAINVIVATPTILDLVLSATDRPLSCLHTAICMGEGLPIKIALRIYEQMGRVPRFRLFNFFGSTETENTVYEVPRPNTAAWTELTAKKFAPAGWPQPQTTVHILSPMSLDIVAQGVEGEICFGGIISDGYWRRDELTAERFVQHPTLGRIYRTGDIGRWTALWGLEVVGRADRQVKIRGMRVELGEVETSMREAADVAFGSGELGPQNCSEVASVTTHVPGGAVGDLQIVAFVAPTTVRTESLKAACERRVPQHLVPAMILALPQLPRLQNQKVDLRALSALAAASAKEEIINTPDSLGVLRARTRGQLEEDRWIQNQQAFWMLVVMLGHFQLNGGAATVDGRDTGNYAWRIEMLLGHGKDMVAFMLMCGFTDSREPLQLGAREPALLALALLMSSPLMSLLTLGYGPLGIFFDPPEWSFKVGHGWFIYSLLFSRLLLIGMHKLNLAPTYQMALVFLGAALTPDDIYTKLVSKNWRIWIWQMDAGIMYKGWRWSFLFMGACYLLGFHVAPALVKWARARAPEVGSLGAVALTWAAWSGFLAISTSTAPWPVLQSDYTYSHFHSVYYEGGRLNSHLVTWHYMTHPSILFYLRLYSQELALYIFPSLCIAVALAYCPWHFKTMGSTTLGNYVLHPVYIGAPWLKLLQEPILEQVTTERFGFVMNVTIVLAWNIFVCVMFAYTFGAAFHWLLVRVVQLVALQLDALRRSLPRTCEKLHKGLGTGA